MTASSPSFFEDRLCAVAEDAGITVAQLRRSQNPHIVTLRDWLLYAHVVAGHPASRISAWLGRSENWPFDALRRIVQRLREGGAVPGPVAAIVEEAEARTLWLARRRMPARVYGVAAREAALARLPLPLVLSNSANREVSACRARIYAALHVPRRTSIPRIATWFNRDHTTIEHALGRRAATRRQEAA